MEKNEERVDFLIKVIELSKGEELFSDFLHEVGKLVLNLLKEEVIRHETGK